MSDVVVATRPRQAHSLQPPPAHKAWVSTSPLSHPGPEVGRTVACSDLRSIPDVSEACEEASQGCNTAWWQLTKYLRGLLGSCRDLAFQHLTFCGTTPGDIAEADQQHLDTTAGLCSTTLHTTKAARCSWGDTAHPSAITTFKPQGTGKCSLR